VKLRYGVCRNDSPFLWDLMEKYTKINAWCVEFFAMYFKISHICFVVGCSVVFECLLVTVFQFL